MLVAENLSTAQISNKRPCLNLKFVVFVLFHHSVYNSTAITTAKFMSKIFQGGKEKKKNQYTLPILSVSANHICVVWQILPGIWSVKNPEQLPPLLDSLVLYQLSPKDPLKSTLELSTSCCCISS